MRLMVNALFKTIPLLASLAFVTLTMTWIFAIFLMSSYKGKFHFCDFDDLDSIVYEPFYAKIKTQADCIENGGTWKN